MNATCDIHGYLSTATEKLTEFVTSSLGTTEANFVLEEFDFHQVSFEVVEEFEHYLVADEHHLTGRVEVLGSDTLVINNVNKYRSRCDDLRQNEQSSPEVSAECKAAIRKFTLAQFGSQRRGIPLHQNQRRIIHHCICHRCDGDGSISCPSCNATQYEQCTACGGHGDHTCHHCGGCGYQTEVTYERDSNGETSRHEHIVSCYCNGGRNTCSSCGGCGETPCTNCSNGYVSCGNCDATGWKSYIFTVGTQANYTISHHDTTNHILAEINALSGQFVSVLGFQGLVAGHVHQQNRIFINAPEESKIRLISRFEAPSITLCTTVICGEQLDDATVEIFGSEYFILDADNILGSTLRSRSHELSKLRKDFKLAFHARGRGLLYGALDKVLTIPIVQKILGIHCEDQAKSSETISRLTHCSVAPEVIARMISDIKILFAFINLWRLTHLFLGSISGYILVGLLLFSNQSAHEFKQLFGHTNENIIFNFTNLIYLPCILLVIQLCESLLHHRQMKRFFGDQYLVARQVQSISTLGAFHSRFFITILLFLVTFFAVL